MYKKNGWTWKRYYQACGDDNTQLYQHFCKDIFLRKQLLWGIEIMKQINSLVLVDKDDKVVEILSKLGMPRNLAKTLLYIYQVDECRSADVEQASDLRQPEVSISMQELERRGWIKKRYLKKKGKGRPTHIYKHSTQLSEIMKTIEQEKIKEIDDIKKDLSKLKNLIEVND